MNAALGPGPVLVVCALEAELGGFALPPEAELLACGVGPVEAAIAVARRLAYGPVRAIVSAGIAGVFEGRGSVGDAVAVVDESFADFGLEGGAPLVLPDGAGVIASARAHPALAAVARSLGFAAVRGLTVSLVTTSDATGRARRDRYDADVETMEGFAVLRAAERAGTPAIEVRGISNVARDRTRGGWNFAAGAQATAAALERLLPSLSPR